MNSVLVLGTELFDDSAPIAIAVGCRHIAMNSFPYFYKELLGLMYLSIKLGLTQSFNYRVEIKGQS